MADWPFFKFFPADWLKDTRRLDREIKGDWIDLLCMMWPAGELCWEVEDLANQLGLSPEQTSVAVTKLFTTGTADGEFFSKNSPRKSEKIENLCPDDDVRKLYVRIRSRRMWREWQDREKNREDQQKHRDKIHGSTNNKPHSKENVSEMSAGEVRSHISELESNTLLSADADDTMSVKDLVNSWNGHLRELPAVHWPLSPSRYRKVVSRLKEHPGVDFWQQVFDNVLKSRFLLGKNGGTWYANFDWIIKNDSNCMKVWEGQYGSDKAGHPGHSG